VCVRCLFEVKLHSFFISVPGHVSSKLHSRLLNFWKKGSLYSFNRRLGWFQSLSGQLGEAKRSVLVLEIESQFRSCPVRIPFSFLISLSRPPRVFKNDYKFDNGYAVVAMLLNSVKMVIRKRLVTVSLCR